MNASVRVPRLTGSCDDHMTIMCGCRSGQSRAGGAVGEGCWAGDEVLSVGGGNRAERSSCGVSRGGRMVELSRGVQSDDLRGARQRGIRDHRGGVSSMWGDNTSWSSTPIARLCPPHFLRLWPWQGAGPGCVSHVNHRIINLKLPNLPLRCELLL